MAYRSLLQEEMFRALFEFATEGILIVDEQGKIVMANPSSEALFGYDKGALIEQPIEVLIPQRFSGGHHAMRNRFHQNPSARSMGIGRDLFGITKKGVEMPVEVSLSPFESNGRKFVIAFVIDISVRKQQELNIQQQKETLEKLTLDLEKRVRDRTMILEEALQQLEISREELQQSLEKEKEVNEMKSRFVSMASHEFRTPLATILSSLTLVGKYSELNNKEKQEHHMHRIKSAVSHMTDLLDDVLSISKLEEGKITIMQEVFDIVHFSENVIQELQELCKKGQKIVYQHQGSETVHIDKKVLRIIYFNFISNAIKFSPTHSYIDVSTVSSSDYLEIHIKDQGIGIGEEDKKHLFERFFRGNNVMNIQGTGLGLSIVARYVELLNGEITVQSALNKGTVFTIKIPNTK